MTRAGRREVRRSSKTAAQASGGERGDWADLNDRLAATDPQDANALRDAVAALYEATANTFEPLLQDFEAFSEAELARGEDARAGRVASGDIAVAAGADPRAALLDASRLLRALEANLVELGRYVESDLGEDLEAAWRTSDGRHYVVPRVTPLAATEGKPFLRRALRHHRVIPTSLAGFGIRLHRSPLAADATAAAQERADPERRYGAALFPGLKVTLGFPGAGLFNVDGLEGFDASATIESHLQQANKESCSAVVWGELTMPGASTARLQELLAERALDGPVLLHFLVAGSWHRLVAGKMRNVALVLDGLGEPLFEVFKWAKFKIDGKREAIEPGGDVHILIDENELVVIAICRDFLQETKEGPYRNLNVDVAIVPSMTSAVPDLDTMLGHAVTANTMRVRFGTRTLVVAQPAYAAGGPVGEVLAFPAKPLKDGSDTVETAFHVCVLETR
jgi:hypothetical protein